MEELTFFELTTISSEPSLTRLGGFSDEIDIDDKPGIGGFSDGADLADRLGDDQARFFSAATIDGADIDDIARCEPAR